MILDFPEEAIEVLVGRGYSREEAERIVFAIGDCIEVDFEGKWVARDRDGIEFARVEPY